VLHNADEDVSLQYSSYTVVAFLVEIAIVKRAQHRSTLVNRDCLDFRG